MCSTDSIFQVNIVRFRYSKYEISDSFCCEMSQDLWRCFSVLLENSKRI